MDTYRVNIFLAGDYYDARRACQEYCNDKKWCVTVKKCDYVYTGGFESGVEVGIVNYPRFPDTPDRIFKRALDLGVYLRDSLFQNSVLIVGDDKTEWISNYVETSK